MIGHLSERDRAVYEITLLSEGSSLSEPRSAVTDLSSREVGVDILAGLARHASDPGISVFKVA